MIESEPGNGFVWKSFSPYYDNWGYAHWLCETAKDLETANAIYAALVAGNLKLAEEIHSSK